MSSIFKKTISSLTLTIFVMITLFGFSFMAYDTNGQMDETCPFTNNGTSLCPQNTLAIAIHHTAALFSFINIPAGVNIMIMVLFLLIALVAIFAISVLPLILARFLIFSYVSLLDTYICIPIWFNYKNNNSLYQKILSWLSRFENSPAVF